MTRNEYLTSDVWDLKEYPHPYVRQVFRIRVSEAILDFSGIKTTEAKQQVKDYVQYTVEEHLQTLIQGKHTYSQIWRRIHHGIRFLSETNVEYRDILSDYRLLQTAYVDYATTILGHTGTLGKTGTPYMTNNMIPNVYRYLINKRNAGKELWDRDIWMVDELNLPDERINPTSGSKSISLQYLTDSNERQCIVLYLKYMVVETKVSFSAIYTRNNEIKNFVQFLHKRNRNLLNVLRSDVEDYYAAYGSNVLKTTLDGRIGTLYHFYEYLQAYSLVETNPFSMHDRSRDKYHYRLKTVEDSTVRQLFGVLDKIDPSLSCMFLIIFCTGMRVSEVCQVKRECLIHNEKGWFLLYYNQKMRKDVMNQIPEALAEWIQKEIDKGNALPYTEEYLFPRAPHKPFIATTFREKLNRALEPYDIRFPNGDSFVFRPHDWRHTLATKMYKSDVDITVIQNVLHHRSIEMTMAYVECDDEQLKRKQHRYLNFRGEETETLDEKVRMSEMRESIKAQMLPNGMCSLPVSMGKCPHANTCMDGCQYFRTDKRYLPVHMQYLEDLNKYLILCERNGWATQYEAAFRVRQNVLNLIRRLENE